MYGIDEVSNMTNEISDANRFLLRNGYSIKNIREERGVYIVEVF